MRSVAWCSPQLRLSHTLTPNTPPHVCDRPRRIEGLDTLTKLRKLVLTNNSIRRVENLQRLQTLEHLLLQGNEIA